MKASWNLGVHWNHFDFSRAR